MLCLMYLSLPVNYFSIIKDLQERRSWNGRITTWSESDRKSTVNCEDDIKAHLWEPIKIRMSEFEPLEVKTKPKTMDNRLLA